MSTNLVIVGVVGVIMLAASIVKFVVLERIAKKLGTKNVPQKDEKSTVMVKLEIYDARQTIRTTIGSFLTQRSNDVAAGTSRVSMQVFSSPPCKIIRKLSSLHNLSYPAFETLTERRLFPRLGDPP